MLSDNTGSSSSIVSSSSTTYMSSPRHTIDQLALSMGFGGIRPNAANSCNIATTNSTCLINSAAPVPPLIITCSDSRETFEVTDDILLTTKNSKDIEGGLKERHINKIDPVEMTSKPIVVTVAKDTIRRSAMLLSGPKFRLNTKEIPKDKFIVNNDIIYSLSVSTMRCRTIRERSLIKITTVK